MDQSHHRPPTTCRAWPKARRDCSWEPRPGPKTVVTAPFPRAQAGEHWSCRRGSTAENQSTPHYEEGRNATRLRSLMDHVQPKDEESDGSLSHPESVSRP